mmetsp:Transcript_13891/g.33515  ORF Transcript_13891/g.33515 Transcript_13891/m.33515 type:complete len:305 (+) Transcript_13891:3528-4442(+)
MNCACIPSTERRCSSRYAVCSSSVTVAAPTSPPPAVMAAAAAACSAPLRSAALPDVAALTRATTISPAATASRSHALARCSSAIPSRRHSGALDVILRSVPAGPGNACVVSVASAAWNEANVGSASVPASPPSGSVASAAPSHGLRLGSKMNCPARFTSSSVNRSRAMATSTTSRSHCRIPVISRWSREARPPAAPFLDPGSFGVERATCAARVLDCAPPARSRASAVSATAVMALCQPSCPSSARAAGGVACTSSATPQPSRSMPSRRSVAVRGLARSLPPPLLRLVATASLAATMPSTTNVS